MNRIEGYKAEFDYNQNARLIIGIISLVAAGFSFAEEQRIIGEYKLAGLSWVFVAFSLLFLPLYFYYLMRGRDQYVVDMDQKYQREQLLQKRRTQFIMGMSSVTVTMLIISLFYLFFIVVAFPYKAAAYVILGEKYTHEFGEKLESVKPFWIKIVSAFIFAGIALLFVKIYQVPFILVAAAAFLVYWVFEKITEKMELSYFEFFLGDNNSKKGKWGFGFAKQVNESLLTETVDGQEFTPACAALSIRTLSEEEDFNAFMKATCEENQELIKQFTRKFSRKYHPDRVRVAECKPTATDTQAVINNMERFCI